MFSNAAACDLVRAAQDADMPSLHHAQRGGSMKFKINLLVTFATVILFAWMGLPVFSVCHGNGGGILSCGLIAFLGGALKTMVVIYVRFLVLLIDGIAHLFGNS
jgi:hypothetical protein